MSSLPSENDEQRLVTGAEQQVGAGEVEEEKDDEKPAGIGEQEHALRNEAPAEPGTVASGADPDREMPSAAEAEDRPEHRLEDEESAAELDDALDDSFPASDPPTQTATGKVK